MKNAISKWFKDCTNEEKNEINNIIRQEELKRRSMYYPVIPKNESELPYYFKTDYINNFSLHDNNYESFCPDCGKTNRIAEFISETGYEDRDITVKCQCGCYYRYNG